MGVELPKATTVIATRTIVVSLLLGTGSRCSPASCPRAGRPACRRSRRSGRARPCPPSGSPRTRQRRHRRRWSPRSPRSRSAIFASGVSGAAIGAAARRRRARAVRRHRAARPAAGQAAGPRRRLPGAPRRRRRRRDRQRQRRPQPRAHRVDRGRADDRAHARDASSPCSASGLQAPTDGGQRPGPRRLRGRRQATTCPSGPPRATSSRAVAGVEAATHVRSDRALVQGKENQVSGIDPATIARFYHFRWSRAPSARSRSSGPTARS